MTPSPYLRNAELGAALERFKLAVLRYSYSNQCLVFDKSNTEKSLGPHSIEQSFIGHL